MENRKDICKPVNRISYLAIGSCISLFIAPIMIFIMIFLERRIADIVEIFLFVPLITSFILSILAFFSISRNHLRGIVCAVVCCVLSISFSFLLVFVYFLDLQILLSERMDRLVRLEVIGKIIKNYSESHDGHLPDAEKWCDLLLENDKDISRDFFLLKRYVPDTVECCVAFNNNLSGLILSEIPGDVVLVFESQGKWNLSGSEELFYETNINSKIAFLLLVNGDIEIYVPQHDAESKRIKSIRWKVNEINQK